MFLGIDVGTSAVKVCLTDRDRTPVATATEPLEISHPHAGWSEQRPEDWWKAVRAAMTRVLADAPQAATDTAAIGLSGQMHGAVLLGKDNQVLRPAILWNDGRSDVECRELAETAPELAAVAGARPMAGFTAPKLLWLRKREPDVYGQIARILLPKDYIGYCLHGGFVTDPCDAAGTWWYDEAARRWSDALCAATATDPAWLPEVRDGSDVAGTLTAQAAEMLGLPAGIPIAAGGGDAAAGAIVAGATAPETGFVSLGTSAQFFVTSDSFRSAPEQGLHSYAHCLPDLWFQMAAMLNGARPMSWFSEVTGVSVAQLLEEAATARTDRLPLFLPYLTGERTPHGDTRIRGAFYGLGNDTGRAEMMRAIMDAIAYSLADACDGVASVTKVPHPLLAIGGGARSDLLLQTIANVLGRTLQRGEAADVGPALGAASLAAVATGAAAVSDIGVAPKVTAVFEPEDDPRHADRLAAYRALYPALKSVRDMPF
ncbi:xylulokinase [Thalassococcus sp. BH17M4-6]|uniref:xylulokinase n=1 Tax=Thalassococcus sp. BH17M4-6 TaxID=3413148 RepID=UPI003BBE25A2